MHVSQVRMAKRPEAGQPWNVIYAVLIVVLLAVMVSSMVTAPRQPQAAPAAAASARATGGHDAAAYLPNAIPPEERAQVDARARATDSPFTTAYSR